MVDQAVEGHCSSAGADHANQYPEQVYQAKRGVAVGRCGPGHYGGEEGEWQGKNRVAESNHFEQLFNFVNQGLEFLECSVTGFFFDFFQKLLFTKFLY